MSDTKVWDQSRGSIHTSKGGFILGVDVIDHGVSLLHDLIGKRSWFEVMLLHVTGKDQEPRLAAWIENLFLAMSYPDARIWCNQVASLAGSLRTPPIASLCAGLLASDSLMYGSGAACTNALDVITRIQKRLVAGAEVPEAVQMELDAQVIKGRAKPVLAGFSRPIVNGDERVAVLQKIAADLSFPVGVFETLVFDIDRAIQVRTGERINLLAYYIAFLLDRGLSGQEIQIVSALFTQSGIQACYVEATTKPKEAFLPVRCVDVVYDGPEARELNRKNQLR